jgi:hypothetical protein
MIGGMMLVPVWFLFGPCPGITSADAPDPLHVGAGAALVGCVVGLVFTGLGLLSTRRRGLVAQVFGETPNALRDPLED